MNHPKRSLSTASALAVAIGLAACGSHQSQASAPTGTTYPATSEEYGSAMGQPGATATAEPSGSATAMPADTTGMSNPSTPSGTTAAPSTMGTGAPSTMGEPSTTTNPSSTTTMNPGSTYGNAGTQGMQGGTNPSGQYGGTASGPMGNTTGSSMSDVTGLDDSQLAAVVQAINMGEIQAAQLAETKATTPEVKRFAHQMLMQHRDMENRATAAFSRMQITPSENALSNQLKSDAQSEQSTLQGERGKDFDRDYIDGQIRDHNHALELIDRMLPNVKSLELKAELTKARAKVENHLRMAERAQQMLQKGMTNKQQTTPTNGNNPY